jgi:pyrroline-5-carboxylate reductase
VLVTMAAGLTMARIRELAGRDYPIIRIMPNTPVSIGKGVVLYTGADVSEADWAEFLAAMQPAGRLEELPETLIDAGSAVSGCGPAFVYLFIEALADGGVECGLPRDKALQLAAQTVSGAAELVLQSGRHPGALKDAVCSPGGTTIAGVHALEKGAFRALGMDAVRAAYDKTLSLNK